MYRPQHLAASLLLFVSGVLLAGCAASPVPPVISRADLLLTNVNLIASPHEQMEKDASVLLDRGRIVAVGLRGEGSRFHARTVIDGRGAVVLAGFWNSHVHLTTPAFLKVQKAENQELQSDLERIFSRWGFTTVFDLASTMEIATTLRQKVEDGSLRGPRILTVGAPLYPANATPVYARPFYEEHSIPSAEVGTPEEAVARVMRQAEQGANGVKLFTGAILSETEVEPMPQEIVNAVTRKADALRLPVFAHPTDAEGLSRAIEGGVDLLAHAVPLVGAWDEAFGEQMSRSGVAMVPTLSLFALNPHPSTPVGIAVQQTRILHDAGGKVLFGTDVGFTNDFDTRAELRLMEQALGWRGVLASLTTTPAEVFGEGSVRGQVRTGMVADLVLVCGNPAENIENLARVALVIRDGEVVYSASPQNPATDCTG